MKFKVMKQEGNVFTLRSTRNVTLLESPEFGSMIVDGKMADSNAVVSGKLELIARFETRPEFLYQSGSIHYDIKDFKVPDPVYAASVQVKIHDRTLGNYSSYPNAALSGTVAPTVYTYNLVITENDRHDSKVLETQLRHLIATM